MAKAKKTTDETKAAAEGAEAKKPAAPKKKAAAPKAEAVTAEAPKAPAKTAAKPAAKKPAATKPAAAGFGFGIDTNLAAQAAAKMLLNRSASPAVSAGGGTVKHLKESMNKPTGPGLGNLLGGTSAGGGKASNLPNFSNQQKGQNQSTGAIGNVGVPRRTPG